jgi:flagellar motility protein MotE (MotC chaperone)
MGSEFASDGIQGDRFFDGSSFHYLGLVLAFRFFSQRLAQNFSQQSASFASSCTGSDRDWRGGVFMQLKMWILSGTAIALWLAPLTALDKKVGWLKSIQGLSLGAGVACAFSAGNIARKLAEENEIETLKTRAITADVVDEIAVSAYVSQAQRQQEAEAILNPVEHLESALALTYDEADNDERSEPERSNQLAKINPERSENDKAERALQLKAKGWGKAKIILEVWGISKGGSQKYKDAEAEYHRVIGE